MTSLLGNKIAELNWFTRMIKRSLLLLFILSAPFTATAGTKADIEALQKTQAEMNQRLQSLESSLQNQGLLEMLSMLEQLQAQIQNVQGQLELQSHELEGLRKRQRELYLDIDRRLNDLQIQGPVVGAVVQGQPAEGEAVAEAGEGEATTSEPAPKYDAEQERNEYKAAFESLREARYAQAIEAFTAFLQKYPEGNYADNAQYWLGEANYVSRNFDQALSEFAVVLERFPRSSKVPDAKLKMGYTYYELQQWEKAREMLSGIINAHPNTSVAPLAEQRLMRMAEEGH